MVDKIQSLLSSFKLIKIEEPCLLPLIESSLNYLTQLNLFLQSSAYQKLQDSDLQPHETKDDKFPLVVDHAISQSIAGIVPALNKITQGPLYAGEEPSTSPAESFKLHVDFAANIMCQVLRVLQITARNDSAISLGDDKQRIYDGFAHREQEEGIPTSPSLVEEVDKDLMSDGSPRSAPGGTKRTLASAGSGGGVGGPMEVSSEFESPPPKLSKVNQGGDLSSRIGAPNTGDNVAKFANSYYGHTMGFGTGQKFSRDDFSSQKVFKPNKLSANPPPFPGTQSLKDIPRSAVRSYSDTNSSPQAIPVTTAATSANPGTTATSTTKSATIKNFPLTMAATSANPGTTATSTTKSAATIKNFPLTTAAPGTTATSTTKSAATIKNFPLTTAATSADPGTTATNTTKSAATIKNFPLTTAAPGTTATSTGSTDNVDDLRYTKPTHAPSNEVRTDVRVCGLHNSTKSEILKEASLKRVFLQMDNVEGQEALIPVLVVDGKGWDFSQMVQFLRAKSASAMSTKSPDEWNNESAEYFITPMCAEEVVQRMEDGETLYCDFLPGQL